MRKPTNGNFLTEVPVGRLFAFDFGFLHTPLVANVATRCLNLILEMRKQMLETIVVVLVILWLLGMVTSITAGGLIHLLLVVAVVVILLRVIGGRAPV